jgi:hypothetical protein
MAKPIITDNPKLSIRDQILQAPSHKRVEALLDHANQNVTNPKTLRRIHDAAMARVTKLDAIEKARAKTSKMSKKGGGK